MSAHTGLLDNCDVGATTQRMLCITNTQSKHHHHKEHDLNGDNSVFIIIINIGGICLHACACCAYNTVVFWLAVFTLIND